MHPYELHAELAQLNRDRLAPHAAPAQAVLAAQHAGLGAPPLEVR